MKSSVGSYSFTDFGANISMPVTHKLGIGAQLITATLGIWVTGIPRSIGR